MLGNKRVNIVLSVIVAICLWTYVVGETNPTVTKTFKNIPIKVKNEKVLEERGFALSSMEEDTVSVTIKGTRNRMNKILDSDISAYVDMEEAAKGENIMRVHVQIPSYMEYEDSSIQTVRVSVENLKTRDVGVVINYENADEMENKPVTVDVTPQTVTVRGAESKVDSVENVSGVIDAKLVSDEQATFNVSVKAVDADGQEIPYVELSQTVIMVQSQLEGTKTVPLKAEITDSDDDSVEKSYDMPENITVTGSMSVLKDVEYILCEAVDLSEIRENSQIPLQLILPDGVRVSEKELKKAVINVTVEVLVEKNVEVDASKISVEGLKDGLDAALDDVRVELSVKGRENEIADFTRDVVTLRVDLKNLGEGTHHVNIDVKSERDYGEITVNPKKIKVVISGNGDDEEN